jgi:aspartyl/asparaginyl beta-hydroxylase (cupin superfamily)
MFRHPNDPTRIIYETYEGLTLEPMDRWTDGKVALVRTGLPHGVKNEDAENRICLCIRIDDYGWEQAKEIYNNFFKNDIL